MDELGFAWMALAVLLGLERIGELITGHLWFSFSPILLVVIAFLCVRKLRRGHGAKQ